MSGIVDRGVAIVGFGHHAPDRVVTNAEIEAGIEVEPGWIASRTGIEERRWAGDDEAVSDIALPAAEMALAAAEERGVAREDIALTLLATSTPDHLLPPTAPLLTHRLGLKGSGGVDLTGACAGYLYALGLAEGHVRLHGRPVLVVSANILSRRINPAERASVVLFSDAAGATVLAPSDDPRQGVCGVVYASDGGAYDLIKIPAGGSRQPFSPELPETATKMALRNGQAVFQKAVAMMADSGREAMRQARWSAGDIDHFVPHQANTRIIEATRRALKLSPQQTRISVDRFGNSSAASIPFTLSLTARDKSLSKGDKILLTAAGAGLTGGAIALCS